jgi:hypothetical protein
MLATACQMMTVVFNRHHVVARSGPAGVMSRKHIAQ